MKAIETPMSGHKVVSSEELIEARKAHLVAILMTQRAWDSPSPPGVCLDFWTSAYQTIDD